MLRRAILTGVMAIALACWAGPSQAAVSVNIGINLPGPPALVAVPSTPVQYAPGVGANYFLYGGQYYVFANGAWYVAPRYNGPWVVVAPQFVPRPLLTVPVGFYRVPPPQWRGWRRDAAPHWEAHWGQRWDEHGHHDNHGHHDDHRDHR